MPPHAAPVKVESTTLGPHFTEMRREWAQTQELFYVLLFLMLLDVVSGLFCSFRAKRINSSASFNGFRKKGHMVLIILALAALDPIVPEVNVAKAMTIFFLFTEVLSIVENAGGIGLGVPAWLRETLSNLREAAPQKVEIVNKPTEPVPADDVSGRAS